MKFFRGKRSIPKIILYLSYVILGCVLMDQILLMSKTYLRSLGNQGFQIVPDLNVTPCHPVTNVMFLKTHKTGSSTVLNIMYRFIENHHLTVALPVKGNIFNYPWPFKAAYVNGFPDIWQKYNMMCNHLMFNLIEVQKVMPNNTFYFSILRNPVSLLESSYTYFKILPFFVKSETLDQFLASPDSYYKPNEMYHMLAKNTMWYDFGYDNSAEDREDYVHSVLDEIEQRFQLLLIAEYFDESMILLKNALCWDLEDVVYFKHNFRSQDTIQNLTQESRERAKQWFSLDWKLYQHFNRTFWKRIQDTIGLENMQKEVKKLQARQKELMTICIQKGRGSYINEIKDQEFKPLQSGSAHILGYELKPQLDIKYMKICHRMILPEFSHLSLMKAYQLSQIRRKL
ncbi:galactose-3-O-sulfotransferase 2 [Microcaecilia unicolor]|uniref:Galactose-3-O-sulfotransferase 2-like n=1 Tax=Microcaecilia unicolor TaxID=1415580 RepID=A0A6P7Z0C1_9AMPH|nr:galactose-3-O-sulfotransferase 2-like [Microcaecilia unicolor]